LRASLGLLRALFIISVLAPSVILMAGISRGETPCSNPLNAQLCEGLNHGEILLGSQETRPGHDVPAQPAAYSKRAGRAQILAAFCRDVRANFGVNNGSVPPEVAPLCPFLPLGVPAVITAGIVLRAFQELPLYRGAIRTDPEGWTLVNLDTYFWCADASGATCADLGEPEREVTLLGRQVRIRPHVTAYTWRFGDGATQTVTAGQAMHVYRSRLTATVTVTLTWSAEYSVGGGGFQPIGGTTTTTGAPLVLPVREARAVLVGG
jgi:hypothetical protein